MQPLLKDDVGLLDAFVLDAWRLESFKRLLSLGLLIDTGVEVCGVCCLQIVLRCLLEQHQLFFHVLMAYTKSGVCVYSSGNI